MAVETLTEFPSAFVAGDTIRFTFSDSRFPSSGWTAKVLLRSATVSKSFSASVGTGTSFNLLISKANSVKIPPGIYSVSFVYTENVGGERQTGDSGFTVNVYSDPESSSKKTIARETLEAMESAFLKLSKGGNLTVNFNGQSFTKRNLKDFQDAIDRQRAIVAGEDAQLSGTRSHGRILHPL